MWWQRSYEGEIFVDHRASPGLPENIARLAGYDTRFCGEGKVFEQATLLCSHCQRRLIKNPQRTRERATCLKCRNHYICDWCDAERRQPDYVHKSFDAKIGEALEKGFKCQSVSFPTVLSPTPPPLLLTPSSRADNA